MNFQVENIQVTALEHYVNYSICIICILTYK